MSRVIVKNLPKKITEEKLRNIFGVKGLITDIQLKYTTDGKFRQFAFIGYKDENDANAAVKQFNNTMINTTKISVEPCALLGDSNKPRAWSKYAPDSTAYKKSHPDIEEEKPIEDDKKKKKKDKKKEASTILEKYKNDPLFEEFVQVQMPNKAQEVLEALHHDEEADSGQESGNEDEKAHHDSKETVEGDDKEVEEEDKLADKDISDKDYLKLLQQKSGTKRQKQEKKPKTKVQLFTLKLKGLPYNCTKKDVKQFFHPLSLFSLRIPRNIKGIAYVGFKTEEKMKKALIKDRSFMQGKRITVKPYTFENKNEENQPDDPRKHQWKSQEESLKNEEDIAESGRIFLRNLAYTVTENDVQELFSKYGPIAEVNLPIDSTSRKPKGFGIITFVMPEHAVRAYSELDGTILQGRLLHLLPGKAKDTGDDVNDDENSNFKKKKAAKQKSTMGLSYNWNSLFLGHDAVADVVADTYGTNKEKVLDPHGGSSAAVRLALGETQIIANTRKYLEEQGVILDAFKAQNSKRSRTVIIVKNLPANTEQKEIYALFEKFGVIGRVVFPPSGIIAMVEFLEPSEARKAFLNLGYSKFKDLPLFLEWAPENSLLTQEELQKKELKKPKVKSEESTHDQACNEENKEEQQEEEEEEEEPEPDTTLFVKNLNFETTDLGLKKHFEGCGKINYATVAVKKDKNNPSKMLSMGYGFVRFVHKASADKALKTLQQSSLDGKSLELKRSERVLKNEVTPARKAQAKTKQTGSKILVRNVPFQANQKELMELFKTFGEIKALRLPKKMTPGSNSHRGFAFVDYVVKSDAKKAFEALSQSTHLYGRRLVLEWASAEEGVEEIRKRTAEHFHASEEAKKSKKSVLDLDKT